MWPFAAAAVGAVFSFFLTHYVQQQEQQCAHILMQTQTHVHILPLRLMWHINRQRAANKCFQPANAESRRLSAAI